MTTVMKNGTMVEIATVGDEGLVGINAFFGGDMLSGETMMQVSDTDAEVMTTRAFRSELERRGALYESVQRYSQGLLTLMMVNGCPASPMGWIAPFTPATQMPKRSRGTAASAG